MEAFPGLEEGYIKKGRSHANLAGTGLGVCGGGETLLEGDLAVIDHRGGFGDRNGMAIRCRGTVTVRLVQELYPAAGDQQDLGREPVAVLAVLAPLVGLQLVIWRAGSTPIGAPIL